MNEQQFQGVRLSPLQQRLWSLQDESPVYFQQCVVAIHGPLDEQQLADSIRAVISRHEILRTVYPKQTGLAFPLQAAKEEVSFVWQQQAAKEGFNYQQEQPLIATLNRTGEQNWELLLSLPSMAADQLTLQQLALEIAGTYNNSVQEDEIITYTRFSDWQHDLLESPDEFAADFWDKYPWKKGNTAALPFVHYTG
jgi:Condensation domain